MFFVFVASAFTEFLAAFDPRTTSVWLLEGKILHLLLLVNISVVIGTIDTIRFIDPISSINKSRTGRCFAVHLLFRIPSGRYSRRYLIVLIFIDGRRRCMKN